MRRTNEEFRAEVFRRKEEIMKKRRKNIKNMLYAAVCMPVFCAVLFVGISLAIAMQPAGGEAPNSNADMHNIVCAVVRAEYEQEGRELGTRESAELAALLERITVYGEVYDQKEQYDSTEKYEIILYDEKGRRKYFYVAEDYVSQSGARFALSRWQYEQISEIISGGETQ